MVWSMLDRYDVTAEYFLGNFPIPYVESIGNAVHLYTIIYSNIWLDVKSFTHFVLVSVPPEGYRHCME